MPNVSLITLIVLVIVFLIVLSSILIVKYSERHPQPSITDIRGIEGENTVNYFLSKLLKKNEYLLNNLLIPLKNGHTTEIDAVIISRKGIFCIEIKNWIGIITGDDLDEMWHQEYNDPRIGDKDHKNPVKQNENHCEVLERVLKNRFIVQNIVIFKELEDGSNLYTSHAFSLSEFIDYYKDLDNNYLYEEELKEIYKKLSIFEATPKELEKHKEDIRKLYS